MWNWAAAPAWRCHSVTCSDRGNATLTGTRPGWCLSTCQGLLTFLATVCNKSRIDTLPKRVCTPDFPQRLHRILRQCSHRSLGDERWVMLEVHAVVRDATRRRTLLRSGRTFANFSRLMFYVSFQLGRVHAQQRLQTCFVSGLGIRRRYNLGLP